MNYPSWRYCGLGKDDRRIINNAEEDEALGEGWADTPAAFYDTPKPQKDEPPQVQAEAEKLRVCSRCGITGHDRRICPLR